MKRVLRWSNTDCCCPLSPWFASRPSPCSAATSPPCSATWPARSERSAGFLGRIRPAAVPCRRGLHRGRHLARHQHLRPAQHPGRQDLSGRRSFIPSHTIDTVRGKFAFLVLIVAVWVGSNELYRMGGVDLLAEWPDYQDVP